MLFALNSPSRLYILCPGCHLFDLTLQSNSNVHTHWNTVWVCLCWADRFAGMEDQTRRHSHEAGKALGFRRQKSPEAGWEPETSKVSTPLNRNSQPKLCSNDCLGYWLSREVKYHNVQWSFWEWETQPSTVWGNTVWMAWHLQYNQNQNHSKWPKYPFESHLFGIEWITLLFSHLMTRFFF